MVVGATSSVSQVMELSAVKLGSEKNGTALRQNYIPTILW
jgi:hypothetical protein